MNSVEKDNILQQSYCCAGNYGKKVADMLLSGHKCAEKEFEKLAMLTFAIDTLICYNAPLEEETCVLVDDGGETPTLTCTTTTTEYTNCLTETEADAVAEIITDICKLCDCDNN